MESPPMKLLKYGSATVLILLISLNLASWWQAKDLVSNPIAGRATPTSTPADMGLEYRDIQVTSSDGLILNGWYIPPRNGALIIMQHGYKSSRQDFLEEAVMFSRAGYGALISSTRAHDLNPGEKIYFGLEEVKDLDAWVSYALQRDEVDPEKLGMLGDSLGASMVIQYAAEHDTVKAVVAHSAFSSMRDTIETSIRHFTGLPPFPFSPLIRFWAEMDLGIRIDDINAVQWISAISPRPVFLIHSLDDDVISQTSGELLFAAAGEPKQLWLENDVGHADFDKVYPEEFERRVLAFFNRAFFPDGDSVALPTTQ